MSTLLDRTPVLDRDLPVLGFAPPPAPHRPGVRARRRRRELLLLWGLVAAFVVVTVLVLTGVTAPLDRSVAFGHWRLGDSIARHIADWVVLAGQRLWTAIVLAVLVAVLSWRTRSWRPLVTSAAGLLALNLAVGAIKLATARTFPHSGKDLLFHDGTAYPSGHASNAALTWGLIVLLLVRYGPDWCRHRSHWLTVLAVAVTAAVGLSSIYIATHWVTDIVAGWMVGGLLLWILALASRRWASVPISLASLRTCSPTLARSADDAGWRDPARSWFVDV